MHCNIIPEVWYGVSEGACMHTVLMSAAAAGRGTTLLRSTAAVRDMVDMKASLRLRPSEFGTSCAGAQISHAPPGCVPACPFDVSKIVASPGRLGSRGSRWIFS